MNKNKGNRTFLDGFADAFRGILLCIKRERNMRVHTVIAAYVLFFAPFLGVTRAEYALLLLTVSAVITAEGFNSSIERLCDKVTKEKDDEIRHTKDIAAGAVLISAIFAVFTGLALLLRPAELLDLITGIFTNPLYIALLVVSIVLSLVYIIKGFEAGTKKK